MRYRPLGPCFVRPLTTKCLDAFGAPTSVGEMADSVLLDFLWSGHGGTLDAFNLLDLLWQVNRAILFSLLLIHGP